MSICCDGLPWILGENCSFMGHYQDINFDMLSILYAHEDFYCFKSQKHISYLVLIT